jgi:hypothetical protein
MKMIAIALLLAAGQAGPPPDAAAMRAAAARCGLPGDWLRFGHDADGDYADPFDPGRAEPIAAEKVLCITRWAEETHARIGFLSEPSPGPQVVATINNAFELAAARAGRRCGLSIKIDPLDMDRAVLLARPHALPAQIACVRVWLSAHGMGPGSG